MTALEGVRDDRCVRAALLLIALVTPARTDICSDGNAALFNAGSGQSAKAVAIGSPSGSNSAWQYAVGDFTRP